MFPFSENLKRLQDLLPNLVSTKAKNAELCSYFFEHLPIPFFVLDDKGNFLSVNQAYASLLDYKASDMVGRNCMDFNHPEDRYQNVEASQMLVQKETDCCSFDKRYVRADGRIVYVHIEVAGIWDAQKKLIGYFGFCLDISERQKNLASLEERERKYRYIYKHNNDLVFTLSKDLKLVFKNEAFDIALGIEGSSVENVGFSDFCTPADLVTINIMQDQILQGQREIIFELKLKNVNSEFIPYEARMSLILKDESQAYFRMFCRDLSYVYETEERIRAVEQKLAEYEEKFLKLRSLFRKQPNFMNLLSQEDLKDFDLL